MRATFLKSALATSISAVLFPQVALATAPSFSCSSNLVVSLDNGYSASCDGNFSLTEGVLYSDHSINLTAIGLLHIGENATLSSPFINLTSKDFYQAGVLNAPGRKIVISTVNGSVAVNSARVNVADTFTAQTASKSIIDWNAFEIDVRRGIKATEQLQIMPGANLELASTQGLIGSGIRVNSFEPVQGGKLVITNTNGLLIANSGLAALSNEANIDFVTQVPEPSTYALMLLGIATLVLRRKLKTS